ncbi:hypothetical protein [Streptomyces sp. D54]|uniref:hypothetical protein n=1 Tax=Streptomyces sp. D54 TaxID=1290289 RepID=UPI003CF07437
MSTAQQLTDELANWTLMLAHVQAWGEHAGARCPQGRPGVPSAAAAPVGRVRRADAPS